MIQGTSNFSGGETTLPRVNIASETLLKRCNGYKCENGSLEPDNLVNNLTGTALTGTTPEQVPFAFVADDSTTVIARDASEAMRECASGVWGNAGAVCDILAEATPVRLSKQIVIPTTDELKVYEPASPSTKLRPLSMKSPADYVASAKPTVTPSTDARVQLFDCDATTPLDWVSADGSCAVDNAATASSTFTLDSTTPQATQIAKKSLGSTGIALTGKEWIVFDIAINDDEQLYTYSGLFINDASLYPSGYKLRLFNDPDCADAHEITSFHIPRVMPEGKVNRIAFKLSSTATVKGVSIDTASFYTAPASGSTASITLYSNVFTDDWQLPGNWLAPAVAFPKSPWIDSLDDLSAATTEFVKIPGNNLLTNAGFENGTTGWTFGGIAPNTGVIRNYNPRTGAYYCHLEYSGNYVQRTALNVTVGLDYLLSFWWYAKPDGMGVYATLTFNDGSATVIRYPVSGSISGNGIYQQITHSFTPPAGATTAVLRITVTGNNAYSSKNDGVDDIFIGLLDQTSPQAVVVLQKFSADGSGREPIDSLMQFCYCYAGKDILSDDDYKMMVSNPSLTSTPDTLADPWRTYTLTAAMSGGMVTAVASAPTAGGTGYAVGDILNIDDTGSGARVRVTAVNAGVVTAVELISHGIGYTTGAGKTTAYVTGTGTGCTVNIGTVTAQLPIDEYGSYLTHALFYRRIYNGSTGIWSEWKYIGASAIGTTVTLADIGADDDALVNGREVPDVLEINNAIASSARYAVSSGGRVYSMCLDYNPETQVWRRPTALQVSSYNKSWAHPTLVTDATLATDGTELDGYAITGALGRGLAVLDEDILVLLDNEFFVLRGDDPITGWRFIGRQAVGCKSNKSIAVGRRFAIWHDGTNFVRYAGGQVQPVSRFLIDSTLIDWTKAHSCCIYKDSYVFSCYYDGEWALLIYDTRSEAWRIRRSAALEFAGICTDSDTLYGLTVTGNLVDVFGGADDDGAASVVREVFTQYIRVASNGMDAQINEAVFDIESTSAASLSIVFRTKGAKNVTTDSKTLVTDTTKTRHTVGLNLKCECIAIEITYTGTTPPTIRFIGFDIDEVAQRK